MLGPLKSAFEHQVCEQYSYMLFLMFCAYIFVDLVKRGAFTLVGEIWRYKKWQLVVVVEVVGGGGGGAAAAAVAVAVAVASATAAVGGGGGEAAASAAAALKVSHLN